jgi:hypothetical protein
MHVGPVPLDPATHKGTLSGSAEAGADVPATSNEFCPGPETALLTVEAYNLVPQPIPLEELPDWMRLFVSAPGTIREVRRDDDDGCW